MTTTAPASPVGASDETAAVRDWLRANARPVTGSDADYGGTDLEPLVDRLAAATVVGLGESTRFSRQTFGVRSRIFRALVERHGFRALAIQDSAGSGERWDDFVRTGAGDPESVLASAWRPWRSAETVEALTWIRAFNQEHQDDPVRIFGVEPPQAESADYDVVLDYIRHAAPQRLIALESHLTPIRTAHQVDEHVQRHQGIHPGRPFLDEARDALALLDGLPESAERSTALAHARRILAFHTNSVAGQGGFDRDERPSADRVIEWHRATGARIAYWDGIAHTAALALGAQPEQSVFRGAGSHLRRHFGADYASVAIGFHHGDLGMATAPDPAPDLIDATLGAVNLPAFAVDLRAQAPDPVHRWRLAPAKLRTISGIYDPAQDADANMLVGSLIEAFDVLIHIRETTPLRWLPEFAPST
ncbi:erythromycin esterase family protein [Nocardia sp. NPDC051463]|uniref:erythromycin esterase family protein n=1 Tax=Nocardia sp. NPDC051463 TaxID=3154845 RepID=UPI0034147673